MNYDIKILKSVHPIKLWDLIMFLKTLLSPSKALRLAKQLSDFGIVYPNLNALSSKFCATSYESRDTFLKRQNNSHLTHFIFKTAVRLGALCALETQK